MTWWDAVIGWFQGLEQLIVHAADQWWAYAVTGLLCWLDGFFPPVPSESIVIALAAISEPHGGPVSLVWLFPIAVACAFLGDCTAYWIGRTIRLERLFRGERGQRVIARAHALLEHRAAVVLLTARFIPIYRVAINMAAGTLRFDFRRFMLIDAVSACLWGVLSVGIGLLAGALFKDQPLLGILAGVLLGLLIGWVLERAHQWREQRRNA